MNEPVKFDSTLLRVKLASVPLILPLPLKRVGHEEADTLTFALAGFGLTAPVASPTVNVAVYDPGSKY